MVTLERLHFHVGALLLNWKPMHNSRFCPERVMVHYCSIFTCDHCTTTLCSPISLFGMHQTRECVAREVASGNCCERSDILKRGTREHRTIVHDSCLHLLPHPSLAVTCIIVQRAFAPKSHATKLEFTFGIHVDTGHVVFGYHGQAEDPICRELVDPVSLYSFSLAGSCRQAASLSMIE